MAISGLHIGLAAAGGYFLAAFMAGVLRFRFNQHFLATVFAVGVAAAYAVISGLAVPAQRAGLMIAVIGAVVLKRRQVRPIAVLATACALIVLASPLASMAPGFKLSFAAVLVLLWLARRHQNRQGGTFFRRLLLSVSQLGAMQLMLLFGLLPLTVLIFGRVVSVAPIVNLLAVPVFSLVTVPSLLIGLVLDGWAQPLGRRKFPGPVFQSPRSRVQPGSLSDCPCCGLYVRLAGLADHWFFLRYWHLLCIFLHDQTMLVPTSTSSMLDRVCQLS